MVIGLLLIFEYMGLPLQGQAYALYAGRSKANEDANLKYSLAGATYVEQTDTHGYAPLRRKMSQLTHVTSSGALMTVKGLGMMVEFLTGAAALWIGSLMVVEGRGR